MKFSKTILAFVMVAVLTLTMAVVAFAADGSPSDPHMLVLDENGAANVTVSAMGTAYYSVFPRQVDGMALDVSDIASKLNGIIINIDGNETVYPVEAIPADGVITDAFDGVNPWLTGSIMIGVFAAEEDIDGTVALVAKPGTINNPIELVADDWGYYYVDAVPAYSTNGFYYFDASDVENKYIVNLDWNTYDVTCMQGWSSSTYFGDTDCALGCYYTVFNDVNVASEDKVIIQFSSFDVIEPTEIAFALCENPGIESTPEAYVADENGAYNVSVPAGEKACYYTDAPFDFIGKVQTIADSSVSCKTYIVGYDGLTTAAELDEISPQMMRSIKGIVWEFTAASETDVETTVSYEYPLGSQNNPYDLVVDENGKAVITVPAGYDSAVYYRVIPRVAMNKYLNIGDLVLDVNCELDGYNSTYLQYDLDCEDGNYYNIFADVNHLTEGVIISFYNYGADTVEGEIALLANPGTMENPHALVLDEEGKATVSVPAGETVYYWVVPQVAADKYLVLGDLGLTVSVSVDGAITPYEVDENGNIMNAFENVDKFFSTMVLVELTNTTEEDIEGTVALGILEEEEEAPQTGVAAALLTVIAVISGAYVVTRRRTH